MPCKLGQVSGLRRAPLDHVSGQNEFGARLGSFDKSPKSQKVKGVADIDQWYNICLCSRLVTKQGRCKGLNEMSLMLSGI